MPEVEEFITRILVFGLPGSGKTTFATKLRERLDKENIYYAYFNGEEIRKIFNDQDFKFNGRMQQANRMFQLCEMSKKGAIADFVCPYDIMRHPFNYYIWMNTIEKSAYEDTDKIFQKPTHTDHEIKTFDYEDILTTIVNRIKNKWKKEFFIKHSTW